MYACVYMVGKLYDFLFKKKMCGASDGRYEHHKNDLLISILLFSSKKINKK